MSRLRRLAALSGRDRRLLLEALLLTALSRVAVRLLPFRWIAWWMEQRVTTTPEAPADAPVDMPTRVRWAVSVAAGHVLWRSTCLDQALTGVSMLRRRGIATTVFLGVAKQSNGGLEAHAWLCSGDVVVTGARQRAGFDVISAFANVSGG